MQFDQLKRREFITLLGGAAAWPLSARAQQGDRMRRIGVLSGLAESNPSAQPMIAAFEGALAKLGWTRGSNVAIEYRWGGGVPTRCAGKRRNWPRTRRTLSS